MSHNQSSRGSLFFLLGHLRRAEFEGQLVDRAGELERRLVAMVDAGAGIESNVEGLIKGHQQRNRVLDGLLVQLLAIHREHSGAAFAGAGSIVFEIKLDGVLARLELAAKRVLVDEAADAALPAEPLQIEEVVDKDRLAMLQEQAVAAEAAANGHDHPLSAAFGDGDLGCDGVVLVQDIGGITDGNPGLRTGEGEDGLSGGGAWSPSHDARKDSVI